ncbi:MULTISPECIES: ABC transporter ATP-binding protein [Salinibaculum]|uniref:ABC transporter ATP-binding protein n=1 Tax=Salinibaculum TaxID=2732368 RepID=UPI0030D21CE3
MPALEAAALTKDFGGVTAVRDLDLTVREGEVFGFLGPNGAGKSTTINIVLDYLKPTSGSVEVFGIDAQADPVAVRDHVGVLPEGFNVLGQKTGREHVAFAAESKGVDDDPDAVLDLVGLDSVADRSAAAYSKGMRQRLALGMAIVGDPDLLILDEPTTGLDPNGARFVRDTVTSLSADGTAVFFSSHILDQVEAVADRVGILRQGELVAVDSIDGLRAAAGGGGRLDVTLAAQPSEDCLARVRDVAGVTDVSADGRTVTVACEDAAKAAVVDAVRADGATVENFETSRTSLDELFAQYT